MGSLTEQISNYAKEQQKHFLTVNSLMQEILELLFIRIYTSHADTMFMGLLSADPEDLAGSESKSEGCIYYYLLCPCGSIQLEYRYLVRNTTGTAGSRGTFTLNDIQRLTSVKR